MSPVAGPLPAVAASSRPKRDPLIILLRVAWMSIALGLFMQIVVSVLARLLGSPAGDIAVFLRDAAQKISWYTLVCAGVVLGGVVSGARVAGVGLAGFLAAPIAFVAAKTVQKSAAGALNAAPPEVMGATVFAIVLVLRAAEYATLGAVLTWLAKRPEGTLPRFLMVGLAAGACFGGLVLGTLYAYSDPRLPPTKIAIQATNEVLFPVGCSLILYASNALSRVLRAAPAGGGSASP